MMNNSISIIMLGLVVATCIYFILKGWRRPAPAKETQKGSMAGLAGAGAGFMVGLFSGAIKPEIFFTDAFLRREGAELGAIVLLAMAFSVVGAICSLLIYGLLNKRRA
jgi:uncharacterized membrane protein YfcA